MTPLAAAAGALLCLLALPFLLLLVLFLEFALFFMMPTIRARPMVSVELRDTADEDKGLGAIRRSAKSSEKLIEGPSNATTRSLLDTFMLGASTSLNGPCLGQRHAGDNGGKSGGFEWLSYGQVSERAAAFGSGLIKLDLIPTTDGMRLLAMYLKNRPEWVIAELGLYHRRGTTVPLYDTLGDSSVAFVINQTQAKTVVCGATELPRALAAAKSCPSLKAVILVGGDAPDPSLVSQAKAAKVSLISFEDVLAAGAAAPLPAEKPGPDDVATFCYTSGTTGDPKGVLLTHRNMVSTLAAVEIMARIEPSDVHLSYLPLAHVLERAVVHALLTAGASIGFFQGDTRKLPDDIKTLRPTLFPSVPRLLNRMHDKVLSTAAASPVKHAMLQAALAHKALRMRKANLRTHWFWDRVVFRKVSAAMGMDRVRIVLSGSAPLAPSVLQFLRSVLCLPASVVQGYGQTETCAGASIQSIDDASLGNVGPPLAQCEMRLVAVKEMDYLPTDRWHGEGAGRVSCMGRGEVWIRGHNVFKGYYKLPEKTAEALTEDGWCMTGDIGIWTQEGALRIIDRKKNIFKLAQGEYVAAEKIEGVMQQSSLIAQAFVYGDSFQYQLVAVVVPDMEGIKNWASSNGVDASSWSDEAAAAKSKELKAAVLKDMTTVGKAAGLHGFEIPKEVYLSPEPFSDANDLFTPSFKLKRPQAKKMFQKELDAMYAALGSTVKVKQGD